MTPRARVPLQQPPRRALPRSLPDCAYPTARERTNVPGCPRVLLSSGGRHPGKTAPGGAAAAACSSAGVITCRWYSADDRRCAHAAAKRALEFRV
eukprot:scaffold853_cov386-Prasinococcus_capsulatus_cf.AAC.26